jgi:hypothetical protein
LVSVGERYFKQPRRKYREASSFITFFLCCALSSPLLTCICWDTDAAHAGCHYPGANPTATHVICSTCAGPASMGCSSQTAEKHRRNDTNKTPTTAKHCSCIDRTHLPRFSNTQATQNRACTSPAARGSLNGAERRGEERTGEESI